MIDEKLLTPRDIAQRLQVNERTVTQWLRHCHLRGYKIGKEWRISEEDLKAFVVSGSNKPLDIAKAPSAPKRPDRRTG